MPQPAPRRSGVLIPLSAASSSKSWGVGEFGDLAPLGGWLRRAGQQTVLVLPLNETSPGQRSPYQSLSAMALDPLYITLDQVPEFVAAGADNALAPAQLETLTRVRGGSAVDYAAVRGLKNAALRDAFARFERDEHARLSARARQFTAWTADEAWWLEPYAVFRAIHAHFEERAWTDWPTPIRLRDAATLESMERLLAADIRFRAWLQWIADRQWQEVRKAAGVAVIGDFPFMAAGDSADVWARQQDFDLDRSIGAPPDAFAAEGQDWGMPAYRWTEIARGDFAWLRARARRSAALYDAYRVDHLVGFYRTWSKVRGEPKGAFEPAAEADQLALGEHVLGILRSAGAAVIVEDLGTVPDFVRSSVRRLGLPGFKVLRWERQYTAPDKPFIDPVEYPPISVATSGTHDTEPLATWWEELSSEDRGALGRLPLLAQRWPSAPPAEFSLEVCDALLESLLASGSNDVMLPIQDVFGARDRINTPAVVDDVNWTLSD